VTCVAQTKFIAEKRPALVDSSCTDRLPRKSQLEDASGKKLTQGSSVRARVAATDLACDFSEMRE